MATPIIMPKLGLTMETGILVSWFKSEGEAVAEGDVLCEIQTDKISNVIESPVEGVLIKIIAQVDEEIPVLKLLAIVGNSGEDISAILSSGDDTAPATSAALEVALELETAPAEEPITQELKASPRARGVMEEHGLTLADFSGFTGERISEADVWRILENRSSNE